MKIICCPGCGSNFTTWTAAGKTTNNKQPLVLSCGHSFCESCLGQKTKKVPTSGFHQAQITCSTCKHITLVENGVKDLPVNVYLSAYIEMHHRGRLMEQLGFNLGQLVPAVTPSRGQRAIVADVEAKENTCKLCVVRNATCKCVDCDSILCGSCFEKVHSLSVAIKHHVPVPLSLSCQLVSPSGGDVEAKCAEHNRILEYFCEDDSLSICSRCYIGGKHQNHSITSIEDKNKLVLEEIGSELPKARKVLKHLNSIDRKIVSIQPNLKTETKSLIENINASFLKLHSLLQAREMEIIQQINSAYKDYMISIDKQREMMDKNRSQLEDAIRKSNKLFENSATFVDGHALLETLKKARTIPCIVEKRDVTKEAQVKWHETNMDNLTDIINAYGSISGAPQMPIQFTTIEETSESVEEDDKVSVNSLGSESSILSVGGAASVPGNTSSVDTGEDVVIEDTDTESDMPKNNTSRHVSYETVSLPIIKGPAQKVTVTHICSPNEFCVQLASSKRQLENLAHNMNAWCRKSNSAKHIPLVIEKDMLLLARYTADKQWYRVKVLGVEKSTNDRDNDYKAHVKYIDFGNDELLPLKELRIMQARFMKLPVFAILCSLSNIAPFEEDKPWSLESIREFHNMTQNQKLMMTAIRMQGAVYEVDLVCTPMADALDDSYVSVRDTLIFLGLARFRTFSDASITSAAPPSYPKVDFIQPTSVKNGATLKVIVSHINSPWDVHIMCLGEEYEYYLSMHQEMQQMYNKDICNIYTLFYPRLDMVCAAKGSGGEWHRAKILSGPVHKEVCVKFVDLGLTETVPYDHLKKLHSTFIILPVQAIPCQLMDVCPVDGQWSDEAKLWCQNNLTGVLGQARFTRCGQILHIVLWLENSEGPSGPQSVNLTLVEKNFAQSTGPASVSGFEGTMSKDVDDKTTHPKEATAVSSLPHPLNRTSTSRNKTCTSTNSPKSTMPDSNSSQTKLKKTPVSSEAIQKTEHKKIKSRGQQVKDKQSSEEEDSAQQVHRILNSDGSPPTQKLETSYIEVYISNYVSPSEFYVQVTDTQNELLGLMKDLQEALNTSTSASSQSWSVKDYCAAKFAPDGLWYRASIVAQVSEDEFEVEYVDFGNVDVVKRADLQPLLPEFGKRMPCAAARCHLANLLPAGSMDVNKWSQTAVEFMATLTKDRKLYIKQEGDPTEMGLPVDLIMEEEIPETAFEPKSHKYHSMRKVIIRNGLAMPARKQSDPDASSPDSPGPYLFQRFIFMNENQPEDLNQGNLELGNSSRSLLPDNTTNNSQLAAGAGEEQRTVDSAAADRQESEQIEIFSLPPYPLPQLKVQMFVVPTHIDMDGIIYVQPYAWEGKCAHLSSEIQRIYALTSPACSIEWKVGLMCVALFPEDGFWYRAQILEIKDEQFKVFYADFGNSAWVGLSQIREMLPGFAKEHPFAYRCVLYDLVPISATETWPAEVLNYIQKLVVNQKCVLVVIEADTSSPLKVQLYKDDTNLCEDLISKNLAISPLTIKLLSEQSSLIGQVLSRQNPYHKLDVGGVGDTFRALMIHIELPNVVYLQRNLEIEPEDSDFVKASEVAEINNTISEFVEMAEKLKCCRAMGMSDLPDVGVMCAAHFSTDHQLYRALCVQCFPETDSCLVVYVDYGTSEIVPRSSLRLLPSEFWSIPAQAVRCHISCPPVCGSGQQLKHHMFVGIVSSLARRDLMARIVSKSPLTVELMVEEDGKWQVPYKHLFEQPRVEKCPRLRALEKQPADHADVTLQAVHDEHKCSEKWNGESSDESLQSFGEKSAEGVNREAGDAGGLVLEERTVPSSFAPTCMTEKYKGIVISGSDSSEDDDFDDVDWVVAAAKLVEK